MVERNFITPEIRADLDRINQDCIRMHVPPPPALFVRCEVSDIETGEIELVQEEKANSFTRNYYNLLAGAMMWAVVGSDTTYGAGHLNIKDTGGTTRTFESTGNNCPGEQYWVKGLANNSDLGVLIGTGTAAESYESHVLEAKIAHGTGAGQMSHAAGSAPNATYTAGTKKWTQTLVRVFSNTSGGTINVSEVGLVPEAEAGGSGRNALVERSLLAAPVAVANNKKITVTYTLEMTFPA